MGGKKLLPEHMQKTIDEHPMPAMLLVFFCNMAAGALLNTGAFEASCWLHPNSRPVFACCTHMMACTSTYIMAHSHQMSYNGMPIWSKLDTGRLPHMAELKDALSAVAFER
mmetsp:Transcript_61445/g.108860  ORF Transcript_61445/g.108860 Transcript_61445/m.108860 type:complete len:111 (+) Transcript_61445:189-521(+)